MTNRIKESELYIPMLEILAKEPSGFLTTSDLIKKLENRLTPQGRDDDLITGRNDTFFSQKVRNIISHKDTSTNPIFRGWVEYDQDNNGLRITPEGLKKAGTA